MIEIIRERIGQEERCAYLPGERARLRYRVIDHCSPETYQRMLERGWRRFGRVFFRPACADCWECRSLRLDVDRFSLDRSMRRNLKRNRDLEVVMRSPSMSHDHLSLYDRYHRDMTARRGWRGSRIAPVEYYQTFVDGAGDFGHEMLYADGDRLLGVALVDVLPRAVSAVYCFYEPEERRRGIGVFSILQHLELARSRGIPHVYLGYWVEGNASMRYKARYRPHEILQGRPELDAEPEWRRVDGER